MNTHVPGRHGIATRQEATRLGPKPPDQIHDLMNAVNGAVCPLII